MERKELGSLERSQLNRPVGKRGIKSFLEESGNVLRLTIATDNDWAFNVNGEALLLDLGSLGLSGLSNISSLIFDFLGSLFGTFLDGLSINSISMKSMIAVAMMRVNTVTIVRFVAVVVIMTITVSIVGVVAVMRLGVVRKMGKVRGELTMLIEERNTIGPDTMELEVLSNVNLVEGSLNVVHEAVVMDGASMLKILHH